MGEVPIVTPFHGKGESRFRLISPFLVEKRGKDSVPKQFPAEHQISKERRILLVWPDAENGCIEKHRGRDALEAPPGILILKEQRLHLHGDSSIVPFPYRIDREAAAVLLRVKVIDALKKPGMHPAGIRFSPFLMACCKREEHRTRIDEDEMAFQGKMRNEASGEDGFRVLVGDNHAIKLEKHPEALPEDSREGG